MVIPSNCNFWKLTTLSIFIYVHQISRTNYFLGTVCPTGWDLFDNHCIKLSEETTELTVEVTNICADGSVWYNSYFAPYWIKVIKRLKWTLVEDIYIGLNISYIDLSKVSTFKDKQRGELVKNMEYKRHVWKLFRWRTKEGRL